VAGALDPVTGMSVDLGIVDAAVKAAVLDRVDHYDLSATVPELDGVITTGENLARTFWQWLEPVLPVGRLLRVAVVETDNNVFEYCGDTIPAR
jgi:6-pyruvoyltetrahydropterin/6-carboxytetrahydropterin synthase